jgi:hypothetical protein
VRYPKYLGLAGVVSMALFRVPLMLNRKISFWKLLGSGKNGTFDIHPDWNQWAILSVTAKGLTFESKDLPCPQLTPGRAFIYGSFIDFWWKFFNCEMYSVILQPLEGHGTWDGKNVFGTLPTGSDYDGVIAVLTRATIRLRRLKNFWRHVNGVATQMQGVRGLIASVGIGEMPWIKQATLSFWENQEAMKSFAYKTQRHAEVIRKTRIENWYAEEMFVRFKPLAAVGSLNGSDPLKGKL